MAFCKHCDHCNADILNGNFIRDRRKVLGWTQTELASRLKVSNAYICDIEKGKRSLRMKGIGSRILAELGIKPSADAVKIFMDYLRLPTKFHQKIKGE